MARSFLLLAVAVAVVLLATSTRASQLPPWRFAATYTPEDLLSSEDVRQQFINDTATWEGMFHTEGVGVNLTLGVTYNGIWISNVTGLPLATGLNQFSAPSKEGLHLSMLALALRGVPAALTFFSQSARQSNATSLMGHVVDVLLAKMTTYERWNEEYPGFAGFMPWFNVTREGRITPLQGWENTVPALDNGEMIAGLLAVDHQLKATPGVDPRAPALRQRVRRYLQRLEFYAQMVFFDATAAAYYTVTHVNDPRAAPSPSQYSPSLPVGYLDDPYEGELFTMWCDLYCQWSSQALREQVWINKRAMLQPAVLQTPKGAITVQRGFWFSAHEQWKLWQMPYLASNITASVFANCERARTWYSNVQLVPGMRASVTGVDGSCNNTGYVEGGIGAIAFMPAPCTTIVTPYSTTPAFMTAPLMGAADAGVPFVWYAQMLNGSRGQGPYGSTESSNVAGSNIAPILTWDSKINTLVGMLGGSSPILLEAWTQDGRLARFLQILNREYTLAFPALLGVSLPLALPSVALPHTSDFSWTL